MDRKTEDIRKWRDDTRELFGGPPEKDDSAHLGVVKGWWKDIDTLLNALDHSQKELVCGYCIGDIRKEDYPHGDCLTVFEGTMVCLNHVPALKRDHIAQKRR
jgi:hypothetical protein